MGPSPVAIIASERPGTIPWDHHAVANAAGPTPVASDPAGVSVDLYRCGAEDCGTQVDVYLRPKIGFCNCATGVSDDEELERVADIELFGPKFSAPGPGREIAVAFADLVVDLGGRIKSEQQVVARSLAAVKAATKGGPTDADELTALEHRHAELTGVRREAEAATERSLALFEHGTVPDDGDRAAVIPAVEPLEPDAFD